MGEGRGVYWILVGKPKGKRPLGRPRCRWENNIKMDLQEVGCGGMNWIFIKIKYTINPSNAQLNPICHLLALLRAHHIIHVSRIRVRNNSIFHNKVKTYLRNFKILSH